MTDDEWKRTTEARLAALETRNAVDDVHRINVENRLTSIEDTLTWLVRLVMGAIIMAAIAYALKGGLNLG
ncbi:hemolysin XhlA family protein [Tritonibacter mobilis]|nr:hemolysin XhlA family protein [Tritonibacter mobilis]